MVSVVVPVPPVGGVIEYALKLGVTPAGAVPTQLNERDTAESNPPVEVIVIVEVPVWPATMDNGVGDAVIEKSAADVIVKVMFTLCERW